jgi:hypothetical protein
LGSGGDFATGGTSGEGGAGGSRAGRGGSGGDAGGGSAGKAGSAAGGKAGNAMGGKAGSETGGAGASGGMGGMSGTGVGGMPSLGAIAPAVQAYCGALSTCCGSSDSTATCEANYMKNSTNYPSLAAGLITVDPTVLAQCQAAYSGANQCDLNTVVAACQGVFKGTRAVNESCTQGYDCDRSQGTMTCVISGDCNVNPMGVCTVVPHAKAGDTCEFTCETGEDCSSTTCGVGPTNALCFEDDGLYCAYFDSGSICRPLTPIGSTCSDAGSSECGSEAYCDVTCKARSGLGEDCGNGCRHELECGDDMKCHDPPWPVGPDDTYSCMGYAPGL